MALPCLFIRTDTGRRSNSAPVNPSAPTIEAVNLTKRYRKLTAIQDVSFSIEKGEVVGFLGPNGAGKSTTMRILCGLIPATSGSARICGIPVATRPNEVKRRIGYMAENNPLPDDMRVIEYLTCRGRLKEIPRARLHKRVDEVMAVCDLSRKVRRSIIGTLSKGYRQRIGVADTILANPQVIIMDEPTIGLDPYQILAMRELINTFRGELSVIISSHILAEIEVSCDRVIIINQGRIVATGNSDSLRREFSKGVSYTLQIKGDLVKLLVAIESIDPRIVLSSVQERTDSFTEVVLETPKHQDQGEEFLRAVHRHPEIRVRSLTYKEPSLEDIFLAATRKSWEVLIPASESLDTPIEKSPKEK